LHQRQVNRTCRAANPAAGNPAHAPIHLRDQRERRRGQQTLTRWPIRPAKPMLS
jgi:hypothetical protein